MSEKITAADAIRLMLLQNVHGADGSVLHHHLHAQDAAIAIRLTRARVGAGAAGRKQNGTGTQRQHHQQTFFHFSAGLH